MYLDSMVLSINSEQAALGHFHGWKKRLQGSFPSSDNTYCTRCQTTDGTQYGIYNGYPFNLTWKEAALNNGVCSCAVADAADRTLEYFTGGCGRHETSVCWRLVEPSLPMIDNWRAPDSLMHL